MLVKTARAADTHRTMSDLSAFDVLIGSWRTEATHPKFDGVVPGRITYEWLPGGRYLLQRSHNDHELFPDALWVIGPREDDGKVVGEYFDSRGVRRTYDIILEDGVLRFWRDAPGFDQRATARLADDEFELLCELAEEPGEWRDDLRLVCRRVLETPS
jgi:hypothetical protein